MRLACLSCDFFMLSMRDFSAAVMVEGADFNLGLLK